MKKWWMTCSGPVCGNAGTSSGERARNRDDGVCGRTDDSNAWNG